MTRPLQLFLIDDDPDDQEIFLMALKAIDNNIQCTIAFDGVDALEKLESERSFRPDFIFMDINMPRMNGIECLKEIKNQNLADGVHIVMYSTTLEKPIIEISRESGAHDFLIKPSTLTILKEKLSALLGYKKQD